MDKPFNPQPLSKERIDKVFEEAEYQVDYVIGLYRIAYPTLWEQIEKVNGFPSASKETTEYIYQKAIAFDKEHHPDVFNGGAWLNNGFRVDDDLESWKVYPCDVTLKIE